MCQTADFLVFSSQATSGVKSQTIRMAPALKTLLHSWEKTLGKSDHADPVERENGAVFNLGYCLFHGSELTRIHVTPPKIF